MGKQERVSKQHAREAEGQKEKIQRKKIFSWWMWVEFKTQVGLCPTTITAFILSGI